MHELDRILDSDDVPITVLVAIAEKGRHRRRFAGTGRTDEHHDPALAHADVLEHRRKAELIEGRNRGVDGPHHHAHAAHLHECVAAEAADARRADREVAFLGRLELRCLLVVHDAAHDLDGVLRGQGRLRHRSDPAVDLHRRREAAGDEEIRAFLLDEKIEQLVDEFGGGFAFHDVISRSRELSPRTDPCLPPECEPRTWQSGCGEPFRSDIDPASASRPPDWSGSTNTFARPCSRGSDCGWPEWQS